MKKASGAVIWEGPSRINGDPIALIVTGLVNRSQNTKTGPMGQTWIVPTDEGDNLLRAVREGRDEAVCGDCPLRPGKGGACYVNGFRTYQRVITTYRAGNYPRLSPTWLDDEEVRWGSWGDPCAVPPEVYAPLVPRLRTWTGYTRRWMREEQALWPWFMASVLNPDERARAKALGWRTFRSTKGLDVEPGEQPCPASAEARPMFRKPPKRLLTCLECKKCDGVLKGDNRPDIVIPAHGTLAGRFPDHRQLALF